MACVLMHALIRIDADRAGAGELEGAPRDEPVVDQILREALAQSHFQRFAQPSLRDVEHEERSGDDAEHAELAQEVIEVVARERIIEGLVPAVEAYLSISARGDHDEDGGREGEE